jgi:hypothetical protein
LPFGAKKWKNDKAGGTKINAAALIDLEERVTDYADAVGVGDITAEDGAVLVRSGGKWAALAKGSAAQELIVRSDGTVGWADPVVLNVEAWGAKPDDFYIDGEATSASKTFKSASAKFTAADVGKTIVILRAGPSNWQDHHTTIAEVKSATEVVLTHAAERTQASARFYISRNGAQDKPIEEAIKAAYERNGSKIVYFPGVGYLTSKEITIKHRVGIEGSSRNGTMIHLAAESNCPVVTNEIIANDTAEFVKVRKLKLDGNRKRQSNVTTTLSAKYTAGGTELKLTDASKFFAGGGVVTIGTNRLTYQTKEGNTLKGVVGGNEGTTDATAESGATITQIKATGIYFGLSPYNATPTTAEQFDPHHSVEDVFIKNTKGDGCQGFGQSDTRYRDVHIAYSDEISFRPSFDTHLTDCLSENSGRMGYFLRNSEVKMTNCKAFFAGGVTAAEGHGFMLEGPTTLEEGTKVLSSCGAQDNKAHGFLLRNAQRCIIQGTASSNGTSSAGTYVGIKLEGIASLNVIDMVCTERVAEPNNTQRNALEIGAECTGNEIRITHGATGSAVVKEAIKSTSDLSGGNDIRINGMGGFKAPAFPAEGKYTPDPYAATTHKIGALTAKLTIEKPSNAHLGCPLRIILVQDGTGGRDVVFNEAFSTTYANTGNTANKKLIIEFVYDGSKWQQVDLSQSATAGTYWI